jgi:hypothetical protein
MKQMFWLQQIDIYFMLAVEVIHGLFSEDILTTELLSCRSR